MQETHRGYGYPAALIIAVLLVPFMYTAFFAFPEGDDFSYALRAKFFFDVPNALHAMVSSWWKWSGRYTHHFVAVFLGDFVEYRATYTGLILFCHALAWLSLLGIARELGRRQGSGQAVFMATFLLFAVLCTYGTVNEWYLHVELLSLTGGYFGILLYVWSLCRLWNQPVAGRGTVIFCVASGIAAIGLYEHSALMVLMITIAAWLLARLYEHPHRAVFFLLVKIAAVCFLLNYLARGNFRRQTKRGMDFALMFGQVLRAGKDWWSHVVPAYATPLWLAVVFAAAWFVPRWKTPLEKKLSAPLILLGCFTACCAYSFGLTLVHAMSDVSVGETNKIPVNIAQYSIVFVAFGLFACRDWLRLGLLRRLGRPLCLVLVLVALVAGNSNFFPVLWDGLLGETARFARAYETRKAVMAAHQGETLTVMPLLHAPHAIYHDTIRPNVKSWPNKYAAPFYGLGGLETVPASPEAAFSLAEARGMLIWKDAGNGCRVAYIPSLPLPPNATYVFDWVFLDCGDAGPPRVRMVILPEAFSLTPLPAGDIPDCLGKGEWPFRHLFRRPSPVALDAGGRTLYAIPLPQSNSAATMEGAETFVSVNNGPFVPAMEKRSR
jgi:hypothetical protein